MKALVNSILKIFGIMTIVIFGWQLLELAILGEMIPNKVDSIVGTILTMSLYQNLKLLDKNNLND